MAKVKNIDSTNFDEEVLNFNGKVIVDLWAAWCAPCRMIAPVIEALSEEFPEVKFVKINVDDNQDTAAKYGVSSIPTILAFENGTMYKRSVGFKPADLLKQDLDL